MRRALIGGSVWRTGIDLYLLFVFDLQFWPAEVTTVEPPVAGQCASARCAVEGQICKPGSRGSISLGYICCGVQGGAAGANTGNWYGTFRLNFHRFDRVELDLRGHTQP